jgi:hypothetical protein
MRSPQFDPLHLELLDRVYEVACLHIEADNLCRTTDEKDMAIEQDALRQQIFALAGTGLINFDPLCDKVLASIVECRPVYRAAQTPFPCA